MLFRYQFSSSQQEVTYIQKGTVNLVVYHDDCLPAQVCVYVQAPSKTKAKKKPFFPPSKKSIVRLLIASVAVEVLVLFCIEGKCEGKEPTAVEEELVSHAVQLKDTTPVTG